MTAGWEEQAVKLFAFMVALDRTEPDRTSTVGHPSLLRGGAVGGANSLPHRTTELGLRSVGGVIRGDLITGGDPYVIVAGYVLQRLLQIFMAERSVNDKGMKAKRHDAPGLGPSL